MCVLTALIEFGVVMSTNIEENKHSLLFGSLRLSLCRRAHHYHYDLNPTPVFGANYIPNLNHMCTIHVTSKIIIHFHHSFVEISTLN